MCVSLAAEPRTRPSAKCNTTRFTKVWNPCNGYGAKWTSRLLNSHCNRRRFVKARCLKMWERRKEVASGGAWSKQIQYKGPVNLKEFDLSSSNHPNIEKAVRTISDRICKGCSNSHQLQLPSPTYIPLYLIVQSPHTGCLWVLKKSIGHLNVRPNNCRTILGGSRRDTDALGQF